MLHLPEDVANRRELLDVLLAKAPAGMAFVDREFRYVWANDMLSGIGEVNDDEVAGRTVESKVPALWPTLAPLYARALAGESLVNVEVSGPVTSADGEERHWLVSLYPVHHFGEITGIGVLVNDVTERTVAERSLSVRNDLYSMLSRTNRAVSQCQSADELFAELCTTAVTEGRFRYAWVGVPTNGVLKMVASAGEDGGYMNNLVISLDANDERSRGPTGRAALSGDAIVVNDFMASPLTSVWHDRARRVGFAASAAFPLKERGEVAAVLTLYAGAAGFFTDELVDTLREITPSVSFALDKFEQERERRRDEAELKMRDRAIAAVTQGIVIADARDTTNPIVYASPSFLSLTGYAESEVIGRNCRFLQGPETDATAVTQLRSAIQSGTACTVELLNYRKDGTAFWNRLAISPVVDSDGTLTHFIGVQSDITEHRRREEHARQAQKMEALGRLAGGVAHDFNNLLTIINGYSDLLLEMTSSDDTRREPVEEIRRAGEHASVLTRQLLTFSRHQVRVSVEVALNDVVRETSNMLARLLGSRVELRLQLAEGLGAVSADPAQLSQVLINLAVNARDAMPNGGALTVETSQIDVQPNASGEFATMVPGSYVRLTVSDSGVGMDDDTKARIFEPFFTTKSEGQGTGLGLATVHGIVTHANGYVGVHSERGRGTTFTVYLPAVRGTTAA